MIADVSWGPYPSVGGNIPYVNANIVDIVPNPGDV